MAHAPTAVELSRREGAWREAIAEAEVRAARRLDRIGTVLGLDTGVRRALAAAGLEIARQFAAESTYANYEHRTGMPWPDEGRALDSQERDAAWRLALENLERQHASA